MKVEKISWNLGFPPGVLDRVRAVAEKEMLPVANVAKRLIIEALIARGELKWPLEPETESNSAAAPVQFTGPGAPEPF